MATISVKLKRAWFGPDGSKRVPEDNPHAVPAAWEGLLPSTATVLSSPEEPKPVEEPKTVVKK